jgi:hypothetical protein
MRNLPCPVILALVITSILFDVACFNSRHPSLEIRLRQLSSGDATHHSAVTFHLLDVDPIHLVMNGELESTPQGGEVYKEHPKLKTLAGKLNARRFGGYSLSPDVFLFLDQSRPLWESHVLKSGQTDATGNAVLDDLPKGTYWLVAYSRASGEEAFWVQQIDIKEAATEVELLRSNALYLAIQNSQRNQTKTPVVITTNFQGRVESCNGADGLRRHASLAPGGFRVLPEGIAVLSSSRSKPHSISLIRWVSL